MQCNHTCDTSLACSNGKCLSDPALKCDGKNDCDNWSDEMSCSSSHRCEIFPYGCSQYCDKSITTGRNLACYCDSRFTLVNKTNCKPKGDESAYLIIASRHLISNLTLNKPYLLSVLPTVHPGSIGCIAYDYAEDMIYWAEVKDEICNIYRIKSNGSGKQILHSDKLHHTEALAVDWIGRNLYWCEILTNSIEVSKLDGGLRRVLYKDGHIEPRLLALHPYRGLLFYADWGRTPHIGRMSMSGQGRVNIITKHLVWPNSIAIDHHTDKLYWSDNNLHYIALSNLDGGDVYYITSEHSIYSIVLFGHHLYWSNWENRTIWRVDKFSGLNKEPIINMTSRPMNLMIQHWSVQLKSLKEDSLVHQNPCEIQPCPSQGHLCLLDEGAISRTCSCPKNFVLTDDGSSCLSNCSSYMNHCTNSYACIPFWSECDGRIDCEMGTDEHIDCPTYHCNTPAMFQCSHAVSSADCIPPEQICDGIVHCQDLSDEHNCKSYSCIEGIQFKCHEKCISLSRQCDGINDCEGGEDELNCRRPTCEDSEFRCKSSGICIPLLWRCDGRTDCHDMSDETHSSCQKSCRSGYLQCKSGKCIPDSWRCDGEWDCGVHDDTDEGTDCVQQQCKPTYFRCKSNFKTHARSKNKKLHFVGKCIPGRWRCDGFKDCEDSSDEVNCSFRNCTSDEFMCKNENRCISNSMICDGWYQCDDKSDEQHCTENPPTCLTNFSSCRGLTSDNSSRTYIASTTSNLCIVDKWMCDGVADCGLQAADELSCPRKSSPECELEERICDGVCIPNTWCCKSDVNPLAPCDIAFQCDDSELACYNIDLKLICVASYNICDGVTHCLHSEDELACKGCSGSMFQCHDKSQCIHKQFVCDGEMHCGDGSDEHLCLSMKTCLKESECTPRQTCIRTSSTTGHCVCAQGFIVDRSHEHCRAINNCDLNKCSHSLCQVTEKSTSLQCSCKPGFMRIIRNHTEMICKLIDNKDLQLIYTDFRSLTKLSLENKIKQRILFNNSISLQLISFARIGDSQSYYVIDSINNELIKWTNPWSNKVKRNTIDNKHSIKSNLVKPKSIVFDIVDQRLIVSDRYLQAILSLQIKENVVVSEYEIAIDNLAYIDQIALDPISRLLFYSCHGPAARISSIRLDGTHSLDLVTSDLELPTSLAVDDLGQRLYFLDAKLKIISSIDYQGGHRNKVWQFTDALVPYTIDVFNEFVYFGVTNEAKVYSIPKLTGGQLRVVSYTDRPVNSLTIHQPYRYDTHSLALLKTSCSTTNACKTIKASCISSLLIYNSKEAFTCLCERGTSYNETLGYCSIDSSICKYGKESEKCRCAPGHYGPLCRHNSCFNFCKNGATCNIQTHSNVNTPTCSCPAHTTGNRCEYLNNRISCLNGGVKKSGKCICAAFYTGPSCETAFNNCKGHGVNVLNTTLCNCSPGYSGSTCEKCKLNSSNCCNNGICKIESKDSVNKTHSCICDKGYVWNENKSINCGGQCQLSCHDSCLNEGLCLHGNKDAGHCICPSNGRYHGKFCEIDNCLQTCGSQNLKTCRIFKTTSKTILQCKCKQNDCLNNALCIPNQYGDMKHCMCNLGYQGELCGEEIGCDMITCNNKGRCIASSRDISANYTCLCKGYQGVQCEVAMPLLCTHNTCHSNGNCVQCIEEKCVQCSCKDGFEGESCEIKKSEYGIVLLIVLPIIITFGVLALIAFILRKKYWDSRNTNHQRILDSQLNLSINNPIYMRPNADESNEFTAFNATNPTDFYNPLFDPSETTSLNADGSKDTIIPDDEEETILLTSNLQQE